MVVAIALVVALIRWMAMPDAAPRLCFTRQVLLEVLVAGIEVDDRDVA